MARGNLLVALISFLLILNVLGVLSATFTVINKCNHTVWPGISTSTSTIGVSPLNTTGFSLQIDESKNVTVPSSWSGRLWGRTNCGKNSTGGFSCVTGDCGSGKVECLVTGQPPLTLAEFTLAGYGGRDFYDVSFVDGFNLPMLVVPETGNCTTTGCAMNLNGGCPNELKEMSQDGIPVGCRSACEALREPQYCCTGAYNTPDTCKPTPYSKFFKNACPLAYSYAFDDDNPVFTCAPTNYVITFCPPLPTINTPTKNPEAAAPAGGGESLDPGSKEIPVSIPAVRKRKVIVWKIMIPVIVSLAAIIMGVSGYMYLCTRKKAHGRGRLKGLKGVLTDFLKTKATYNDTPNTIIKAEGEEQELLIFNLACLSMATNNFCLENKLGQGGFGPVYKGKLQNGQHIAVKRLSKSSGQGIEEFKNEVVLISKLQHRNLVKLLGCCVEGEENMLVYEYMSNKSLDAFLFDPRNKACLVWEKRFDIVRGIARGLLYLHRDSRLRVIHRDLKVSNVLLDENMIPKISDFGMARIFGGNQTRDVTSRRVGTIGYMSPEYVMGGTFSEKSDVFSFGVLLLEVVSGKRNNSFYDPEQPLNLLLHAWRLWNEGKWSDIVDEDLGGLYSPSEVMKCVHIGLLCGQNRAADRPTMAEVDYMLNYETDRPSPKEPPYTFPASSSDNPGIPPIRCSNNNVTLTTVAGR